ncbi:TIGR02302 family protein [Rhodobacterales bacterium HKCCE3408]|nr:TIGR02302 family protein [Rhodobacterales bacterium HKCCE3408]
MTDQPPRPDSALARLTRPLALTRLGMAAERLTRRFWPVWSILFVALAALAFRIFDSVPPEAFWIGTGVVGIAFLWALYRGLRGFRWPTAEEAEARLDATLPGRPISTLRDSPAIGGNDAESMAVWRAHLARMAARLRGVRAPSPDLRVAAADPFALRLIAATALAVAVLFGAIWRIGDVGSAVVGPGEASVAGPSWEGWVEPPLYTGRPTLYLNDISRDGFAAPVGSRVTVRFYGSDGQLTFRQTISAAPLPEEYDPAGPAHDVNLDQTGLVGIDGPGGRAWDISAMPDNPPEIAFDGPLEGVPPGQMQMPFAASDDYAVLSGRAIIRLNAAAADRRYGLAVEPEEREPLVLDLPMPFSGGRDEFSEILVEDLAQHPFANLPVTISLEVTDHAGQIGTITENFDRLPGRRFFDPVANALIEMRRDLLWSRENAQRTAQVLRAITWRADRVFEDEQAYLLVRTAIRRLESAIDMVSGETRDEVAAILWDAALMIEEGDLANALDRLRRAQDRLAEAMRQGASDEEIAQLMDELRQAMDEYMQELAQNAEPGTDQPDQSGENMEMSMSDIEEMMRRIEELIQQGRMAEAQEMMDALRQMLENMQMTQGGNGDGPRTPGQQAMEGLQDTLRDQQDLSDDSFQQLQDQFNQNRPGNQSQNQQGQQGQSGQGSQGEDGSDNQGESGTGQGGDNEGGDARSLAERQQELLRRLQEQAENLPGLGTESGEEAQRLLDQAGRAMDDAADALEGGDLPGALDNQSEAMEALREGMGELGRALAEEQGLDQQGQGTAQAELSPDGQMRDPLGRQAGSNGAFGTDENFERREEAFRRARELMDELRRRSAEQDRPEVELDYLRRLLERF